MSTAPQNNNDMLMGILSYLGILVLIPILAAPNSKFARFHANQGLVLFLAGIAVSIITLIPILGAIIGFVGGILTTVLAIIGIINACKNEMKPLPIIGKFVILK